MSNDLISRSAFVKEINEHMKNVYECDIESVFDFQDDNKSEESYIVQGLFEAFELIGNVPAAYDVDKVVEKVESRKRILEVAKIPKAAKAAASNAFMMSLEDIKSGGIEQKKKDKKKC